MKTSQISCKVADILENFESPLSDMELFVSLLALSESGQQELPARAVTRLGWKLQEIFDKLYKIRNQVDNLLEDLEDE